MAKFSFGFTQGRFLQLYGQKHLRSVAEDLISNKQKELNEFIKNGEGMDIIKLSSHISQQFITLSDSYSACGNKYHVMKTSSAWLKYLSRSHRI